MTESLTTADLAAKAEEIVARGREVLRAEALRRLPEVLAAGPLGTFEERWRAELAELAHDAQAAAAGDLAALLGSPASAAWVEELVRAGMRLAGTPRRAAPGASAGGGIPWTAPNQSLVACIGLEGRGSLHGLASGFAELRERVGRCGVTLGPRGLP